MPKLSSTTPEAWPEHNARVSENSHGEVTITHLRELEVKLRALEKQLDSLRWRSGTTLSGALTPKLSMVEQALAKIDRWAYPVQRPPRTVWGGICTLLLIVGLLVYGVVLYILYRRVAPETTSKVEWSAGAGPYPLVLTCYAEQCLVSWHYDEASVRFMDCPTPRCLVLGPEEQVTVDVCYSQLPGQGVRLHFGGEAAWGDTAAKLGLTDNTSQHRYGLATTSFMDGPSGSMPMQTPLRSGVSQLAYVRTDNGTLPDGDSGRVRHEWFSVNVAPTAHDTDFMGEPCALSPPETSVPFASMERAALLMQPDYTHITVKPRPGFGLALLGEIGGAGEAYSAFVLLVLLAFYKAMNCRQLHAARRSVRPAAYDPEKGTT